MTSKIERCGAYSEQWEQLGKPKGWFGCSLPKGHIGNHKDDALYTSPTPDSLLLTDEEIKSIVYQWNSNGTRTSILFVALAGEKLVAKAQLAKVSPLIAKLEAENKRLNELIKALDGLLWKGVNLIDGEDEFKEESNDRK